jgi:Xaa-Pro aminopeptidase
MSCQEFSDAAPRLPPAYVAQRYDGMLHQAGLEDEGPVVPYPYGDGFDERRMPEGTLEAGMVLCLECYAGKRGAAQGVKLEDQVLLTPQGARRLCDYPYETKLLGRAEFPSPGRSGMLGD